MATKSANLYARIEPDVKEQAESILSALGIPASNAINMFYKQIILNRGLPFEVKIPTTKPVNVAELTEIIRKIKTMPPKNLQKISRKAIEIAIELTEEKAAKRYLEAIETVC